MSPVFSQLYAQLLTNQSHFTKTMGYTEHLWSQRYDIVDGLVSVTVSRNTEETTFRCWQIKQRPKCEEVLDSISDSIEKITL